MLSERETIEILRDIALTGGEREARRAVRMMREIWAKSPEPNPSPAPFPLSTVGWPEPGCSRCGGAHRARECGLLR